MLRITAGSVEPHIAFGLRRLAGFPQNLQRGLVRMEHAALQELPVQFLIDRLQPVLGRLQDPIGHRLAGQHHAAPVQFLFLPVKRRAHYEFLGHNVRDRFRGGKAPGDHRFILLRFYHGSFGSFCFAGLAGIAEIPILADFYLSRNNQQRTPDFLANFLHDRVTYGAGPFFLRKTMLHHFNGNIVRQYSFDAPGPLLTGMRGDLRLLRLGLSVLCENLSLVKQQAKLLSDVVLSLLGRRPEALLPSKAYLLHEPIHLLGQFRILSLHGFVFRA